ncbi:MAG: SDR family oxidoreductase [Halioglobus sp.]|nr:SDR family oxidoreductase [Halioglobus sp.]
MRTIMITGATNGIGKVTALELARRGHRLILANRSRRKAEDVRDEILAAHPKNRVDLIDLDLASRASVRACAEEVTSICPKLDTLINNAGLTSHEQVITEDGFELQFQVNALSQFQLTLELLPALSAAAPSQVIFVTSLMHKFGKLDFDSFRGWKKYNGQASYNQSKLAMMLLARELAEQFHERDIAVNTLHPGAVNTGILDGYSPFAQFFLRKVFVAPEKGARTTLFLAKQEPASMPSGKYFVKSEPARTHKLVEDQEMRRKLWDVCCDFLGDTAAAA